MNPPSPALASSISTILRLNVSFSLADIFALALDGLLLLLKLPVHSVAQFGGCISERIQLRLVNLCPRGRNVHLIHASLSK